MPDSSPSSLKVDVIRTRFGPLQLALDLQQISTVLDYREGHGLQLVDPAPHLGLRPLGSGHVGFVVAQAGPPVGVMIGHVQGFETWTASRIVSLPRWLKNYLPEVLKPACGIDDNGDVIWMLDLLRLTR